MSRPVTVHTSPAHTSCTFLYLSPEYMRISLTLSDDLPSGISFTCRLPPVILRCVRRFPFSSSEILNTLAPKLLPRAGSSMYRSSASRNSSTPSSFSAEPKKQGIILRPAIALFSEVSDSSPLSANSFKSSSSHIAAASANSSKVLSAEKLIHSSPNLPQISCIISAWFVSGKSILFTNINTGILWRLSSLQSVSVCG